MHPVPRHTLLPHSLMPPDSLALHLPLLSSRILSPHCLSVILALSIPFPIFYPSLSVCLPGILYPPLLFQTHGKKDEEVESESAVHCMRRLEERSNQMSSDLVGLSLRRIGRPNLWEKQSREDKCVSNEVIGLDW